MRTHYDQQLLDEPLEDLSNDQISERISECNTNVNELMKLLYQYIDFDGEVLHVYPSSTESFRMRKSNQLSGCVIFEESLLSRLLNEKTRRIESGRWEAKDAKS
jgi:sulfur relay (sulfurtransferase) DsrF/TusC family protein